MKIRVTLEVIEGPTNREPPTLPVYVVENSANLTINVTGGLSERKRILTFECDAIGNSGTTINLGHT